VIGEYGTAARPKLVIDTVDQIDNAVHLLLVKDQFMADQDMIN
jgi:hypothetical protein